MAEHFVYILFSEVRPKTYVGLTPNIGKRLQEHNSGCNSYTKRYKPWKLVYLEKFSSKTKALAKEKYFKSHAGRNQMKKLINDPR